MYEPASAQNEYASCIITIFGTFRLAPETLTPNPLPSNPWKIQFIAPVRTQKPKTDTLYPRHCIIHSTRYTLKPKPKLQAGPTGVPPS